MSPMTTVSRLPSGNRTVSGQHGTTPVFRAVTLRRGRACDWSRLQHLDRLPQRIRTSTSLLVGSTTSILLSQALRDLWLYRSAGLQAASIHLQWLPDERQTTRSIPCRLRLRLEQAVPRTRAPGTVTTSERLLIPRRQLRRLSGWNLSTGRTRRSRTGIP